MKKTRVNLGKKLTLSKDRVLRFEDPAKVYGGADTIPICPLTNTCPANSLPCNCIASQLETCFCSDQPTNCRTCPSVGNPCCI